MFCKKIFTALSVDDLSFDLCIPRIRDEGLGYDLWCHQQKDVGKKCEKNAPSLLSDFIRI